MANLPPTIFMHHPTSPTPELGLGEKTYKPIDEHGTFELPREDAVHLADAGWKVGKHPKAKPPTVTEPPPTLLVVPVVTQQEKTPAPVVVAPMSAPPKEPETAPYPGRHGKRGRR